MKEVCHNNPVFCPKGQRLGSTSGRVGRKEGRNIETEGSSEITLSSLPLPPPPVCICITMISGQYYIREIF